MPWVIFWAFAGTLFGGQPYFYIGRAKGQAFVARRPGWQTQSERIVRLLNPHQAWFLIAFRFLYGLRTVTPFLVGASGVSPARFLVLNTIGAALWAVVIGVLGYAFGQTMELALGELKHYEIALFATLAVLGTLVGFIRWRRRSRT